MDRPARATFLALVLAQAGHVVEEYVGRLYEVFPPARWLSGLFSEDLRTGFLIVNALFLLFGAWCYAFPIRRNASTAAGLAWFWVVLELVNGTVHVLWATASGAYRPGVITAPLLLTLAGMLGWRLSRAQTAEAA